MALCKGAHRSAKPLATYKFGEMYAIYIILPAVPLDVMYREITANRISVWREKHAPTSFTGSPGSQ
jgi:hypothetical protein